MKLKKLNWKALMLSMGLAVAMLSPMTMNAQRSYDDNNRGLFGMGYDTKDINRDGEPSIGGDLTLGGATQEDPVPVGSGLLILVAAGAGYVALKRKEDQQ